MHTNLDGILHNYEIHAARLPLYTVSAAVRRKLMPYAIETEVVKRLAAMTCPSTDKSGALVYVLLKSNVASEGMEIGCLFKSEEKVFVLPREYPAVFPLLL